MGQPVKWAYALVIEPKGEGSEAVLYRVQHGSDTRFSWARCSLAEQLDSPGVDDVLAVLYNSVLVLMEATA